MTMRASVAKDMTGMRFGKWTVLDRAPNRHRKIAMWNARCDCGTEKAVSGGHLRSGASASCGCVRAEVFTFRKHGASAKGKVEPEFIIWRGMLWRCHGKNPHKNYGARGITVCERWRNDYAAFKADMGPRPGSEYTIERKDNDGGYSPENCCWATRAQQSRNKRDNRKLTHNGVTKLAMDWGPDVGLPGAEVRKRVLHGMSAEEALTKPLRPRYKLTPELVRQIRAEYARGGVSMQQIAARLGMHNSSICNLINRKSWCHVD